jgi:hypothetical protein
MLLENTDRQASWDTLIQAYELVYTNYSDMSIRRKVYGEAIQLSSRFQRRPQTVPERRTVVRLERG